MMADDAPPCSNVEIKARVHDMAALRARASAIAGNDGTVLLQDDTFFDAPKGRLKLRMIQRPGDAPGTAPPPAELIYYERPDTAGPKTSRYSIARTDRPAELRATLALALGERVRVEKERVLYLIGQTRVHCDTVAGLGTFMELEVVMRDGQSAEEGEAIAHDLMGKLGIAESDLVTGAYADQLQALRDAKGGGD